MRNDREQWIIKFIADLDRLVTSEKDSAATLAKLRRGFSACSGERDIWVYSHLRGASPEGEKYALYIASLFALWHQGGRKISHRAADSFGGSYGRLRVNDDSKAVEKRFAVLIDSHTDDLPDRLRRAVIMLRSKEIGINWENLLLDLLQWKSESRLVQRRWARDFWAGTRIDQEDLSTWTTELER